MSWRVILPCFWLLLVIVMLTARTQGRYMGNFIQPAWKRSSKCCQNSTGLELDQNCNNNGFIFNPDPTEFYDRYVCYRQLGEYCLPGNSPYNENRCMKGLVCACNICQNCISNGTMVMCNVRLCPQENKNYQLGTHDSYDNILGKLNELY